MDNRELVTRFYEDIWNRLDMDRMAAVLHDDFTFRGSLGPEKTGHAEFADYVTFVTTALGDYRCDVQDIVSEGDRAFARVLFSGVHRGEFFGFAPTGKRVQWIGAALFTVEHGKVSDIWVLGDVHGLLERLSDNAA